MTHMDKNNDQKLIDLINQVRQEIEISFGGLPNSKKILISSSNIKHFYVNNENNKTNFKNNKFISIILLISLYVIKSIL